MSEDKSRLDLVLEELDLPDGAYQRAADRYADLGQFFSSPEAQSASYDPHIYPQGSFRLGTVVRPLTDDDDYDLDVGCRLRTGIAKSTHTQKQLKELVGDDLRRYRSSRNISQRLDEKRRCWRLHYRDTLPFHMDVVPSIPEEAGRKGQLRDAVTASTGDVVLAGQVALHAGAITDTTDPYFLSISSDWRVSNSEGYAIWFASRMQLAKLLLEQRAIVAKTTVDKLPMWRWHSPLQESIRLLKRHRDVEFKDRKDSAPISIIITTLAARAYNGETELSSAIGNILKSMHKFVSPATPRVPNPVNPQEDFADKWGDPAYAGHRLEANFFDWLLQANRDFQRLTQAQTHIELKSAAQAFGLTLSDTSADRLISAANPSSTGAPAIILGTPPKPWAF